MQIILIVIQLRQCTASIFEIYSPYTKHSHLFGCLLALSHDACHQWQWLLHARLISSDCPSPCNWGGQSLGRIKKCISQKLKNYFVRELIRIMCGLQHEERRPWVFLCKLSCVTHGICPIFFKPNFLTFLLNHKKNPVFWVILHCSVFFPLFGLK